jgi:hypothetical protein
MSSAFILAVCPGRNNEGNPQYPLDAVVAAGGCARVTLTRRLPAVAHDRAKVEAFMRLVEKRPRKE